MDINLSNCNSIESGTISIVENTLNIKYAVNGTGKSTISRAMESDIFDRLNSTNQLLNLKPFKYRKDKETNNPKIEGLDSINSISIFNENYIDQYVFLQDELLKDSFEVFIHDEKYEEGMQKINEYIKVIGDTFIDNHEIDSLMNDLLELSNCFGNSKGLAKSSSVYKGIGSGNKIQNIPEGLNVYKDFLQNKQNVKWLKWQMSGNEYLEISNICPFCTNTGIEDKKETILAVKKEYNSKLIEHLNKVIDVIHRLSSYFTEDTYNKILAISQSVDGLKDEYEKYLLDVRDQINILYNKLAKIKTLGFQTLKDFSKVKEVVEGYKIDIEYIGHMNTDTTSKKVGHINGLLENILEKAGQLQGEINKQKKHIEKTIKEYNDEINSFLQYAGYNYQVNLEENNEGNYKLKLKHNEFVEDHITNVKLHLSYGERNAFALVLFMFEVIKNNPDLIILDDPISSFDKNKKYAIIDMLFRGEKSLRGKTVLLLTHDFDPIVDMIYHLPHKFQPVPKAAFLENVNGILTEKSIEKKDVKTFLEIVKENIFLLDEDINKLIYLRRLFEVNEDKDEPYQLLSNLFKKREIPEFINNSISRPMTPEEIEIGTSIISEYIHNFNYDSFYKTVADVHNLISLYEKSSNNYEKLQLYRIINIENSKNDIIRKFVNETYHLENDYMYQLNPCEYQVVPQFIINECDKDVIDLKQAITV
ncbi:AAA family ATPase [Alkalihalobacillus sp. TS-13]|uniref:AAA family ATPase n=1 Tax=Alkalihalobacillus sp. TS-13 TaxID=2842455 RepID=UPI001C86F96F|nr:AAA family ATPase [Alkalihalobacillus sp. TS-13]